MPPNTKFSDLILPLTLAGLNFGPAARASDIGALRIALPGEPKDFAALPFLVAQNNGHFARHGLRVRLDFVSSGAAAAKAVLAGKADVALAPTQFVLRLIANSGAPLKAVWGFDRPDWLLASMNSDTATCASLKGARIGIDAKRGARWTQLNTILSRGCRLKIDKDVKTIALGSSIPQAMTAGTVQHALLHLNEVKEIEISTGRPVHIVASTEIAAPGLHHLMLIASSAIIEKKRADILHLLKSLGEATTMINDPTQLAKVATAAKTLQASQRIAAASVDALRRMSFYPQGSAGLDKARIEAAIRNQIRIGKFTRGKSGIRSRRPLLHYGDVVDLSPWRDARQSAQ